MAIKSRTEMTSGSYRCGSPEYYPREKIGSRADLIISVSNNPGGNNPFLSESFTTVGSLLRNRKDAPYEPMNPGFHDQPSEFYDISSPFLVQGINSSDWTTLEARTNPANARILMPVFLLELKDLPDMIRQGGRIAAAIKAGKPWKRYVRPGRALQDTAAANLAIQFGWRPFISDLLQIANFQNSLDKRARMFDKLATKGLRGKVDLGSVTTTESIEWPLWSICGYVQYTAVTITKTSQKWGSIRWTLRDGLQLPKGPGELLRRDFGFTVDQIPLSVWEALPWSWLVDYFVNIGDMLKAGNRVIATPSHECIMEMSTNTWRHKPRPFDDYREVTEGVKTGIRRNRTPYSATSLPSVALPILSAGQLSILGSLHVTRARVGGR